MITPVVYVRNVSDVLLCSGRLGKAVVACLSGTTAIQKDNNKRLKKNKIWIPESVISNIPKKRNSVTYIVSWYMMPCTCSMTSVMFSTPTSRQEASTLLVLITVALGRPYSVNARAKEV